MKYQFLICFYLIQTIYGYYESYDNDTFVETAEKKTCNDNNYQLSYDKSQLIPTTFKLRFKNSDYDFLFNFEQANGALNDLSRMTNVFVKDNFGVKKTNNQNLTYSIYYDNANTAVATLISNDDINIQGISTKDPFRVMISCVFNRTQINFIPAVFYSNKNKAKVYLNIIEQYPLPLAFYDDEANPSSYKSVLTEELSNKRIEHGRTKRAINGLPANLFVEYLIVLDNAMYTKFRSLFNTTNNDLLYQYMKIFYCHLVNGIDNRYKLSLQNDPDLMLSVRLANILIYTNQADTPWTNVNITGVPGIPLWNGKQTALATTTLSTFTSTMNNRSSSFNFTYDHAVAILSQDIWGTSGSNSTRSGVIGYAWVGGIGGTNRYSLVEDIGFNNIQNAAHELGHNLGATHDGSGSAINCSASLNNIMTSLVGAYTNVANLYYFSNCSKRAFKSVLLTPDYKNYTAAGLKLLNVPLNPLSSYFNTSTYLPGQLYTTDDQCRMIYGPKSSYASCKIANDPICNTLYCYDPIFLNCFGTTGYGALDGTTCGTGLICWQTKCVNSTNLLNNTVPTCSPNPCLNGGVCFTKSLLSFCNCTAGFSGQYCELVVPITTTTTSTTSRTTTTTRLTTTSTTTTRLTTTSTTTTRLTTTTTTTTTTRTTTTSTASIGSTTTTISQAPNVQTTLTRTTTTTRTTTRTTTTRTTTRSTTRTTTTTKLNPLAG